MPLILTHPLLQSSSARISTAIVLLLRSIFFATLIIIFDKVIDFGTSPTLLIVASALGVVGASILAFSRLTNIGFALTILAIFLGYRSIFYLVDLLPSDSPTTIFKPVLYLLDANLLFIFAGAAAFSTWFFWRFRHALTIELILLGLGFVALLSGHRNYHFGSPRIVNSLAWTFGIENLSMLVALGASAVVMLFAYSFFATIPGKPIPDAHRAHITHSAKENWLIVLLTLSIVGGVIYLFSDLFYRNFLQVSLSRTANGVGEESKEGLSPLGFHSALGSTNQPAALVRLEGDYEDNPFAPMLYLRESALSEFNGHEMVLAPSKYDTDITRTRPGEPFKGSEDLELQLRTPVVQSIYLLTNHDNPFALDYPLSLTKLVNPNPSRFKSAIRAYSMAPAFKISGENDSLMGDPRWSEETRKHYLVTHPDPRYSEVAHEITKDISTPLEKSFAITQYLSKTAIYTLTPNHDVKPDQDQVAPFLFGDHRGYCVHFAHATVYMLRALGIPARIATGYLTDLRQARDGHILLRMSDRYAWGEIYITGKGWIPFDTQPEKVESHAETQVDMKLLEDLMNMIGPGEEILPKDLLKGESQVEDPPSFYLPDRQLIVLSVLAIAILIYLVKLYLHFSWMLPAGTKTKVGRSYRSLLCRLHDLGYHRDFAETREEFSGRMSNVLSGEIFRTTSVFLATTYAKDGEQWIMREDWDAQRSADFALIKSFSWWRRLLGALSPSSAFWFLRGGKW